MISAELCKQEQEDANGRCCCQISCFCAVAQVPARVNRQLLPQDVL